MLDIAAEFGQFTTFPIRGLHRCLYLDNLFLNENVAHALLALGIGCMGTTRKNAKGVPSELLALKDAKRAFIWGSMIVFIVRYALIFCWQDNNAVISITTSFKVDDYIMRSRKRPKATSINVDITRSVFGDSHRKLLLIPKIIDRYNHHIGGVDVANHLRSNFTIARPSNYRNWRPKLWYLIDICKDNAYKAWLNAHGLSTIIDHNTHRKFLTALAE